MFLQPIETMLCHLIIGVCLALSFVFMIVPVPHQQGLKKYRIALRFLTLSYLSLGVYFSILLFLRSYVRVDFFSFLVIAISFIQAILFTAVHVVLLNPAQLKFRFLVKLHIPLFFFVIAFIFSVHFFGNPQVENFSGYAQLWLHPTVLLRQLFFVAYILQLGYLTWFFFREEAIYKKKIDGFYADNFEIRIGWLRYSFISALAVGIFVIFSSIFQGIIFILIEEVMILSFYVWFAIRFIQYPKMYPSIHAAIVDPIKSQPMSGGLVWEYSKKSVIDHQLHLKQGVTIDDICQHLKVSRNTLSAAINTSEGENFNSWINQLRIEEAKVIMKKHPEYSLSKVAEMVGFSEISNFSRQFKLITNYSPSVWRQI